MPQAKITINAVIGSDTDLPINTIVQLDNVNIGGEVSFFWEILDQPPGAADVLSDPNIQNPTFTPKKEGSYLIRLTVNASLVDEQIDSVVAAVRQLKSRIRIPAAGETTQVDLSDGWAADTNDILRSVDDLIADPGVVVGANATGGTLAKGDVVRVTSGQTIKSGLPGQETVPGLTKALASTGGNIDELLAVVESDVFGATTGIAAGALVRARWLGRLPAFALGSGAVGDPIYVSDTGTVSITQGTALRQIGSIMSVSGADRDLWIDGTGAGVGAPNNVPYLVNGNPGALINAFRVDGLNADQVINNTPITFFAGDNTTIPLVAKRFGAGGADPFQIHDETGSVLARVHDTGSIEAVPDGTSTTALIGTGSAPDGTGVYGQGGSSAGTGVIGVGGTTGNGVHGIGGATSGIGVRGEASASNGIGVSGQGFTSGAGVQGTGGTSGYGLHGIGGLSSGAGVYGEASAAASVGVMGLGVTSGAGVSGTGGGSSGRGVSGQGGSSAGVGVYGRGGASGGPGGDFHGGTSSGDGVRGTAGPSGTGVVGVGGSTTGVGVTGTASAGNNEGGVFAGSGSSSGITSTGGATGHGVSATGGVTSGRGLSASAQGGNSDGIFSLGHGTGYGVYGFGGSSAGTGVRGEGGTGGDGVLGIGKTTGDGVVGTGGPSAGAGVRGTGGTGGSGVVGVGSGAGDGVVGTGGTSGDGGSFTCSDSVGAVACRGVGSGNGGGGYFSSTNAIGCEVFSVSANGVQGASTNNIGVYGISTNSVGVYGQSSADHGVTAVGDVTSPAKSAFRIEPQNAQPTGPNAIGDMYVTSAGVLRICTAAGSPGTWVNVGSQ